MPAKKREETITINRLDGEIVDVTAPLDPPTETEFGILFTAEELNVIAELVGAAERLHTSAKMMRATVGSGVNPTHPAMMGVRKAIDNMQAVIAAKKGE